MKKIDENYDFAIFLKANADDQELDEDFKRLHKKYFANYDCSKCRKCCKKLHAKFQENEIKKVAQKLNLNKEEFIKRYLKQSSDKNYSTKRTPCPFLKNNKCILEEDKPKDCKEYPFTNKKERIFSLYATMDNTLICPVVNNIIEELKEIYHFKVR